MDGSQQKPYVFLCQPSYNGLVDAAASDAFSNAGQGQVRVKHVRTKASLIPHGFNLAWAMCVDTIEQEGYTHWGMIHADIVPQQDWLEVMLREMAEHQADAIAAVVPIKDGRGRTSTAVERNGLIRKLTVYEATALPAVLPDGQRLLLNTGLFLVSLADRSWLKCTPFNTYSEIDWSSKPPKVDTEGEDWHFSRKLHALGKKLVATTAVTLSHDGWSNRAKYPDTPDQERRAVSLLDITARPDPKKWHATHQWRGLE